MLDAFACRTVHSKARLQAGSSASCSGQIRISGWSCSARHCSLVIPISCVRARFQNTAGRQALIPAHFRTMRNKLVSLTPPPHKQGYTQRVQPRQDGQNPTQKLWYFSSCVLKPPPHRNSPPSEPRTWKTVTGRYSTLHSSLFQNVTSSHSRFSAHTQLMVTQFMLIQLAALAPVFIYASLIYSLGLAGGSSFSMTKSCC